MRARFFIRSSLCLMPLLLLFWLPTHSGCGFLLESAHFFAPKQFSYKTYEGSLYDVLQINEVYSHQSVAAVELKHVVIEWSIAQWFRHGVLVFPKISVEGAVVRGSKPPSGDSSGGVTAPKSMAMALPIRVHG